MDNIYNFIKGIFIGIGAILPGISSGVICMATGLYEKLLDSILGFFKNIKSNIKFLFPILFGGIIGIIIFSNIILYCFDTIPCQTKSLFIGLLLGSLYILYKQNCTASSINFSFKKILSFFICFFSGILLIYIENIIHISTDYTINSFSFLFLVLSGFLMSIGIVVPGVSSTVILMILGVYNTYLSAVSIINMNVLSPMIIGVAMGTIIFMKIIKILLDKFHLQTMNGIIGFSLGSVFILYPTYTFNLTSIISLILLILGFIIGKSISTAQIKPRP